MRLLSKKIGIICLLCIILTACSTLRYKTLVSENSSFRVKSLVMHFTAVDYATSIDLLINEGYVSSHYLIPQSNDPSYPNDKLEIYQLVEDELRAWHAGVSYWQGRTGLNDTSIGIEIVNIPECMENEVPHRLALYSHDKLCTYPDFEPKQIELLVALSKDILERHPDISPTAVVGHSDIAPSRKHDPGPRFPWYQLYEAGVGAWYDRQTLAKYWHKFSKYPVDTSLLQSALSAYGYRIDETGVADQQTTDTIAAFQMHFLPWQVSGTGDASTTAAVFALLEKYFPKKLENLYARYNRALALEQNTDSSYQQSAHLNRHSQIASQFSLSTTDNLTVANNRRSFKSYIGQGEITIEPENAQYADIFINGEKLNITQPFVETQYRYNLQKRTVNGTNTLKVDNILPINSAVNISINYPTLSEYDNSPYDFAAVDELINKDIKNGFPGASLLVIKDGRIIKNTAYGFKTRYDSQGDQIKQARSMSTDTLFDLAENTKTFATTLAAMKLVSEQKLQLNSPVHRYLPEYMGAGKRAHTVEDLLSHTSGHIVDIQIYKRDNSLGEHFFSQKKLFTSELLLTALAPEVSNKTEQAYNDTNFMILGLLVERITGKSLDDFVENEIYAPLGLSNTAFNPKDKGIDTSTIAATALAGNTLDGRVHFDNVREYTLQGEVYDEKAFYAMQGVAGHAGLFSNTHDLAVLSQLMLNGGGYDKVKIFDNSTLARFTAPTFAKSHYGLGWQLNTDNRSALHFGAYASPQAYGHTGSTGTVVVIDPSADLAIVLLTNKKHSPIDGTLDNIEFVGDRFATGKYGDVMTLIYEAILHNKK